MLDLVWPLSLRSLPVWTAFCLVFITAFARSVFARKRPAAVEREQSKKRLHYEQMVAAILDYVEEQDAQSKDSAKGELPDAERVYNLLWDNIMEVETSSFGKIARIDEAKALLARVHKIELKNAIDKTKRSGETLTDDDKAAVQEFTEFRSGEKLREAIKFTKEIQKNLGSGLVDKVLLSQANEMLALVNRKSNHKANILKMLRPVLPTLAGAILFSVINVSLRGYFHQIGKWTQIIEMGVSGEQDAVLSLLAELWFGHLVIEAVERVTQTFQFRTEDQFLQRVRTSVMRALVQQDYEYFNKHSPGVLQERLNRDACQLGQNLIQYPLNILKSTTWIIVNLGTAWMDCPSQLFVAVLSPLIMLVPLQWYKFKTSRRTHSIQRKVEEELTRSTSQVLREFKTVRQFSMEAVETSQHAQAEVTRGAVVEKIRLAGSLVDWLFWSVFVSDLILVTYLGLPYVRSGEMKAYQLTGVVFKLSANIAFPLRDLLEKLGDVQKVVQPLNRVCDLLASQPNVEDADRKAFINVSSRAKLDDVLSKCRSTVGRKRCRTTLEENLPIEVLSASAELCSDPPKNPAKGSELFALQAVDKHYVNVQDLAGLKLADLQFPVQMLFSSGLRPQRIHGKIEFQDVHFAFPTDPRKKILNGLSFKVEPGQKVALVGSTGCGKSTCMSLLHRLYDPQQGRILIDDIPITEYDIQFLRSRITIVDQHTVLMNTTIRENITYGLEGATDAQIIQACKDAKAWDFICEKPDKLMTMISDGGKNLSGGQRQRLAIARAIIRNPDVILLDEATSALDNENEALVQETLDELAKKGSALVIAHRLSTIKDSDRILVLHEGKLVESGSHEELLSPPDKLEDISDLPLLPPRLQRSLSNDAALDNTEDLVDLQTGMDRSVTCNAVLKASANEPRVKTSKAVTYSRLWEIAHGNPLDNLSVQQMQDMIDSQQAKLKKLRLRVAEFKEIKSMLVAA